MLRCVDQNLDPLSEIEPTTKFGLLGFESKVHVYGDCQEEIPIVLSSTHSWEDLEKEVSEKCLKSLSKSLIEQK